MVDEFDAWNALKKKLNRKTKILPLHKKSIYWVHVGLNVGAEVFGKGENFLRPVLVISKFIGGDGKLSFYGVPLSSKSDPSRCYRYEFIDSKNRRQTALLQHAKMFDNRRVYKMMNSKISEKDFDEILRILKEKIIK